MAKASIINNQKKENENNRNESEKYQKK